MVHQNILNWTTNIIIAECQLLFSFKFSNIAWDFFCIPNINHSGWASGPSLVFWWSWLRYSSRPFASWCQLLFSFKFSNPQILKIAFNFFVFKYNSFWVQDISQFKWIVLVVRSTDLNFWALHIWYSDCWTLRAK